MSKIAINESTIANIKSCVTTYCTESGESISDSMVSMVIDMLVQKFVAVRSFPSACTSDYINSTTDAYFSANSARIAFKIPMIVGRMGSEGETSHNENGLSRQFQSADPLYDVFPDVVQYAKVN